MRSLVNLCSRDRNLRQEELCEGKSFSDFLGIICVFAQHGENTFLCLHCVLALWKTEKSIGNW